MKPFRERIILKIALLLLLATIPSACREQPRFDFDFERSAVLDDFRWKCGTLLRIVPEHATSGTNSLEVTFFPGASGVDENYPGFSPAKFNRNWSVYRTLAFDAFVPGDKAVRLALRIDDRVNPNYEDRFNAAIPLAPGNNHIAIPLANLVTSGSKDPLNHENILGVMLFLANPQEQRTIFFDRIRVE